MAKLTRTKAMQNAEKELRQEGFRFSYLTEAYSKPNMFIYQENTQFDLKESRLFVHPTTRTRVIVTKTGHKYYLTH